MAQSRRRHAPLAWVGIAVFMALPSLLMLGFGHWSRLICEPRTADTLRCRVDRAVAWGLIPTTQTSLEPVLSASVASPTCTVDYCVYSLTLNSTTGQTTVFRFYAQPRAVAAAADLNQWLTANPAQAFQRTYHEPLYLLAVSGALLVLSSGLAIAGLRRNT